MKRWRIQFFGKFEIWAPDGNPIVSPTIKVKAVIGLLALDRRYGMSRERLGQVLWPEASVESRRNNVKQALAVARKIVGPENLETSGALCRLSDAMEIESDLTRSECHRNGFMLGFESDWFDETRRHYEGSDSVTPASVSGALTQVLRWHAQNDPDQMFEMMRSNIYLTLGIGPAAIEDLCRRVESSRLKSKKLQGWDSFWRGLCSMAQDVDAGIIPLEIAFQKGVEQGDLLLSTESLVWAGYAHILRGRSRKANRLAELAKDLVSGSTDQVLKSKVGNLSGTALLHMGKTGEAIQRLLESNDQFERNSFEWGQNVALCGLYHACDRKIDEAERLLVAPRQIAKETGHVRLSLVCALADAHILLASGSYENASTAFRQLSRSSADLAADHFQIYAEEGQAMSSWNLGDRPEALQHLKSSRQLRVKTNMPYSTWDRQRMGLLESKVARA